jgi:hypothetical protein
VLSLRSTGTVRHFLECPSATPCAVTVSGVLGAP